MRHLAALLTWSLLIFSNPAWGAGAESDMERELRLQQELLSSVRAAGETDDARLVETEETEAPSWSEQAESRSAAPTPSNRELPPEIFDEELVIVEEGRWGNSSKLRLVKRVLDADGDGSPELIRFLEPDGSVLVRQLEDRDYDGKIDAWSDFEWGKLTTRALDSNHDGEPDIWERYRADWMESSELDRNFDTVRDLFFRYESGALVEEAHDSNNDGAIDLRITFRERMRERAEEDHDLDGRVDVWTVYAINDGNEWIERVERDKRGRGRPDVFETFEIVEGRVVRAEHREDLNGDGEIDVVRFYRHGKLIRMEIVDTELMPM